MNKGQILNKVEEFADQVLRKGKHFLPHVARLCIVSTFIEDGIRMWSQWESQRDYMMRFWDIHYILGTIFVLVNLFGQLGGAAIVLGRKYVNVGIAVLFFVVILQTIAYNILMEPRFLLKNLALLGGLVLLVAENKAQGKSLFAGLPSMGEGSSKTYLQLSGRLLLVLMFLTLIKVDFSSAFIIVNIFGGLLALLIAIGYKTKLASLTLVLLLSSLNVYVNNWWSYPAERSLRDYLKYDFFQTLSVVGGLLLVVALGPGGYSLDEHKKKW
ncbi:hypothetical protein HELRODRAFT_85923 [Helobdella robusta]|uniref:Surfeit locus protein 4 n=1 Tax=Helobdella robusta TaxID=6412 RepID=T1G644_HELRO|nr:hypothetical protein HELRODRAFT_85923 [Helobdella robusta]ESN96852.1 hypothetical protein HELRODRAFT_85923 [Helobdella robusta]